eukprot:gene24425-31805_t
MVAWHYVYAQLLFALPTLLALASEALLDSGKYMEFAEILCCPMTLSPEEALVLYPELWRL